MSWAFISAIKQNPNQSYVQLLNSIRDVLQTKYSQKPQLSCSHPLGQSSKLHRSGTCVTLLTDAGRHEYPLRHVSFGTHNARMADLGGDVGFPHRSNRREEYEALSQPSPAVS